MNLDEYARCDAIALRGLIEAGDVSVADVRDAALRAIETVEPRINAVAHGPYPDAVASDHGPLAGVPFAVKDTEPEAGRPMQFGTRLLEGYVSRRDATLAERFRDAGLASLARSTCPEFAFATDTAPAYRPATRNPWDLSRSPGGSSGGAAALVASGALPMAHANDAGGSIRIPAAWCGLVGLKPSRGRVPIGPAVGEAIGGFAHEFAVTRSVRDAALLLDCVSGPAAGDRYYVSRSSLLYDDSLTIGPPLLRVALHTGELNGMTPDREARDAAERVAVTLEQQGHRVDEAVGRIDAERVRSAFQTIYCAELASMATTFAHLGHREIGLDTVEHASLACIRYGRERTALEFLDALATVNATARTWGRFLDDYDVFVCPTTSEMAPASGSPPQNDPAMDTADQWLDALHPYVAYTQIANITGQPAITLPVAQASDGMPIGVMLMAQTLREDVLLQVSAQLEELMPWAERRPSCWAGAALTG